MLNDDLQGMEIWVQEIKQARRKHVIKKDMTRMNEPEYDSDLSDFDKQFFSSSGRFNINQIKSSLQQYNSTRPLKESKKMKPTFSQYNSLNPPKNLPTDSINKNNNFKQSANKTWDLISSPEFKSTKIIEKPNGFEKANLVEDIDEKDSNILSEMFKSSKIDQSKSQE